MPILRRVRTLSTVVAVALLIAADGRGQDNAKSTAPPAVGWDSLDARMKWEAERGFNGVVLVARDGEVVFHKAFGMANREKKVAMKPDTVLAIGSTPIDFTHAGILLLAEQGKLKLSDPVSKYVGNVPDDKKAITLEHLMTGRSGLQDFHDVPADKDKDHSWIDRDEAVRRILGQKLLFEPGKGRAHSHSAWGLLAAVIEVASGKTYPEFTREHLFKPAGMTDTGFFGEKIPDGRTAVGYGPRTDGEVNAPPHWGKTSWLVMGSGGQVSTAEDMWRWTKALRGGKILSAESLKRFGTGDGIGAGGDVYGFEILFAGTPKGFMVVMSNSGSPKVRPQLRKLADDLAALVTGRKPAKFALGVQFEVEPGVAVRVAGLSPGGAAEKAGLRAGDKLVTVGGKPLGDEPLVALSPYLQSGDEVTFEVERDGKRQTVKVKPTPR